MATRGSLFELSARKTRGRLVQLVRKLNELQFLLRDR
jgi:hypothetical protein